MRAIRPAKLAKAGADDALGRAHGATDTIIKVAWAGMVPPWTTTHLLRGIGREE